MLKIFLISLVVLSLFSCENRRNPNLSEQRLAALIDETSRKVPIVTVFSDTAYIPPVGAIYDEIRSVDPASPPITLKVSLPEGAKYPLKLSQLGSTVEYVTISLPQEDDFFLSRTRVSRRYERGSSSWRASTHVTMIGDHFITSDVIGIRLFDPSGKFVQNLLVSEFHGQRNAQQVDIEFGGTKTAMLRDIADTRAYLGFVDENEGLYWAGEFNLASLPLYTPQTEVTPLASGVEMVPVRRLPAGQNIDANSRFSFRGGGNMLAVTFNNMGDTLAKFANHVRLEEGQTRGPANSDRSFSFRSDGDLFFRQAYCDTVFRVETANRIVPVYRFDFGDMRASLFEGTTSRTQDKLLPWKLIDLKNSLILIFTQNRDCPNCRANDDVTFYCTLFDKRTGHATAIDMQSQYPENALIINDIDNGLPAPLNAIRREGDVIIATFTKIQIEEILNNNARNISAETAVKMRVLAEVLKPNELLVMKIK